MTSSAGVVVFDYTAWLAQYPIFAAVTQPVAQGYFDLITLGGMVDNSPCSIISDLPQRTQLLYLAVCHFAAINGAINPSQAQVVGRVNSASQGSVSASFDYNNQGGQNAAFWNQTTWGAQYYAMTLRFRTSFYVPPRAPLNTIPGGAAIYPRRFR